MTPTPFVIVAVLLAAGGGGYGYFQLSKPSTAYCSRTWTFKPPPNSTDADLEAWHVAVANHDPAPPGWPDTNGGNEVTGTFTGKIDPWTFRRELVVTVRDETNNLSSASFYLNDDLVCTVTRTDGGIVDDNGRSTATLTVHLPLIPRYTAEVRWVSDSGFMNSASVSR